VTESPEPTITFDVPVRILEQIVAALEDRVCATMSGGHIVCKCDHCRAFYWAEDLLWLARRDGRIA
jgi:hypothetical protein